MKKLRLFSVILLLLSAGAFGIFQGYKKITQDQTPPVLTCDTQELQVSVKADNKELLKGVKALDDRSGDVSDTLVVEYLSELNADGTRVIRYAAVDEAHNVGRCERTLSYQDYQSPVFRLSAPLCYTEGESVTVASRIHADSVLDGDLSAKIKYSLEDYVDNQTIGEYPIEFRVMDSAGSIVYLDTKIGIVERDYRRFQVDLKAYLIFVPVGAQFHAEDYFKESEEEGILTIQSDVDTTKKGTYYVDYYVDAEGVYGMNRMIVVVQ